METVTITEFDRSGDGEDSPNSSVTLTFHASGSDDYNDVAVAIFSSSIPLTYLGLVRQQIDREYIGGGHWYLHARYSADVQQQPPLQYGDPERITWDTTGGTTVRRTHATLVGGYSMTGTVPDNGDAINVTEDGVEGIDVEVGGGIMTIDSVITAAQASQAYGRRLQTWAKKYVNNAEYRGFAAGEVRFMGGRMTERADGYWDLSRTFDVSENVTGQTFAGVTGIDKKGHEYVWALTQRTEDPVAKTVVVDTVAVYVHELFPAANFALLEP